MRGSFAFAGDTYVGGIVSETLQRAGFELAAGLGDADFIVTYCLAQSQLEDVYLGSGGAVESAREGCCLVDLSPSTAVLAKEVYAMARVNELQAIDAPLVLKDPCAHDAFGERDNLMALVGGEDAAFAQARELLDALASEVRYVGLAGMGQLAKAVCTTQQASALVALVEAQALSQATGGDARLALEAAVAGGLSPAWTLDAVAAMVDRHFHGTHTCQVMMGELTAVIHAADENDLVFPQAEACQHLLEMMLVVGGSDLPATALALAYASDEECASYGLDWNRAAGLYDGDAHEHHDRYEDEEAFDDYGYDGDGYDGDAYDD